MEDVLGSLARTRYSLTLSTQSETLTTLLVFAVGT